MSIYRFKKDKNKELPQMSDFDLFDALLSGMADNSDAYTPIGYSLLPNQIKICSVFKKLKEPTIELAKLLIFGDFKFSKKSDSLVASNKNFEISFCFMDWLTLCNSNRDVSWLNQDEKWFLNLLAQVIYTKKQKENEELSRLEFSQFLKTLKENKE